jgi:hypothetical protein
MAQYTAGEAGSMSSRIACLGSVPGGNVGPAERWVCIAAGLGLTLAALSGRGPMRRLAMGAAGMSLLSRGTTGYCAMKAALTGDSSLGAGLGEQARRLASSIGMGGQAMSGAARIDSFETMYAAEVRALASAERQLRDVLQDVSMQVEDSSLQTRLRAYATELNGREQDLHRVASMQAGGAAGGMHTGRVDDAMHALIAEMRKMAGIARADPRRRGARLAPAHHPLQDRGLRHRRRPRQGPGRDPRRVALLRPCRSRSRARRGAQPARGRFAEPAGRARLGAVVVHGSVLGAGHIRAAEAAQLLRSQPAIDARPGARPPGRPGTSGMCFSA